MKSLFTVGILLFFSGYFISCKKDKAISATPATHDSIPPVSSPHDSVPPAPRDSVVFTTDSGKTLLKFYIVLDTSRAAPQDTLTQSEFGYDNFKRLSTKMVLWERGRFFATTTYFYNAADTLPSKSTMYTGPTYLQNVSDTTEKFYTYDFMGRCTYDSTANHEYLGSHNARVYEVYEYKYNADVITRQHRSFWTWGMSMDTFFIYPQYSNGLVISCLTRAGNIDWSFANIQYDRMINPLMKLNFNHPDFFLEYQAYNNYQPENLLEESDRSFLPGGPFRRIKYQYTYNQFNYPILAKISVPGDKYWEQNKLIFKYTDR